LGRAVQGFAPETKEGRDATLTRGQHPQLRTTIPICAKSKTRESCGLARRSRHSEHALARADQQTPTRSITDHFLALNAAVFCEAAISHFQAPKGPLFQTTSRRRSRLVDFNYAQHLLQGTAGLAMSNCEFAARSQDQRRGHMPRATCVTPSLRNRCHQSLECCLSRSLSPPRPRPRPRPPSSASADRLPSIEPSPRRLRPSSPMLSETALGDGVPVA
jgi:hypothetical protein